MCAHIIGLDIGCGEKKPLGMLGLDVRRTTSVDIVADARLLPFKDGSFDRVSSSDTVEHFGHREVARVLAEWVRVLRRNGAIDIVCPDLRARSFLFFLKPDREKVKNIYGEQDYLENYHKCGFSFGILRHLLESCGIRNVKRIISGYKGIRFIPDCLHVRGIKS